MAEKIVRKISIGEVIGARTMDISKYKDAPYPAARWIGKATGMKEVPREDGSGSYMMLSGAFAILDRAGDITRSGLMICPEPLVGEVALSLADETDAEGTVIKKGAAEVAMAYDIDVAFNDSKGVPYTFQYRPLFQPEALGKVDPLAGLIERLSTVAAIGADPAPAIEGPKAGAKAAKK